MRLNKKVKTIIFLNKYLGNKLNAIEYFKKGLNEINDKNQKIEYLNKSIELNPNVPDVYCEKGKTLNDLGKNSEAIECYDKAIQLNPSDSESINNNNIRWNNKNINYKNNKNIYSNSFNNK